jgi:hypothetical protein
MLRSDDMEDGAELVALAASDADPPAGSTLGQSVSQPG